MKVNVFLSQTSRSTTSVLSVFQGGRCFLPFVPHVKKSNSLLTPSEFPQQILWFGFPPVSPRDSCSYLSNTAPARIHTNCNPHILLPVFQVRNSSNQTYLLLGVFKIQFFRLFFFFNFTRDNFKPLLASTCRFLFIKAVPQYTMHEIYVQVQFTFQILNRTLDVLFYLLYLKYLLTTETVPCFLRLSGSRRACFFILQIAKRKQIIVASDEMQDPGWIYGSA